MKPQFTKEQLDDFWNAADSSRGDKSRFRTEIFQLIEAINDSYENEAELQSKVEEMQKVLQQTRTGISNAYEFGYLKETEQNDVHNMLERIDEVLKGESK